MDERALHDLILRAVSTELKGKVDLAVIEYMDRAVRYHLEELIKEAKDEATKNIAAKLLKLALEERS